MLFRVPESGYVAKYGGGWWKWVAKTIQLNGGHFFSILLAADLIVLVMGGPFRAMAIGTGVAGLIIFAAVKFVASWESRRG